MRMVALLAALSLALFSTAALADTPSLMNYQGTLTDSNGVALDTAVAMTFSIYADSTGGSSLWSETHSSVPVSHGIFNVLMGSVNALSDTIFKDSQRWLGLQVGVDPEIEPRQRIVAMGYAFHASKADTADYTRIALSQNDGDWTIDGDNVYRESGNVGIGTGSPQAKLHVNGVVRLGGGAAEYQIQEVTPYSGGGWKDYIDYGGIGIGSDSGTNRQMCMLTDGAGTNNIFTIATSENGGSSWKADFVIQQNGNVGIGTASPSAKLDVQGTLNVGVNGTGHDVSCYGDSSGGKLFWDGSKMALRAGRDSNGNQWAPDSIGLYSLATGFNTKAIGSYSTAMGFWSKASGLASTAIGYFTNASAISATALGYNTLASGEHSTAMGFETSATNEYATAMGNWTTAAGRRSTAMGLWSTASGYVSTAMGYGSTASGSWSTSMGYSTTASEHASTAMGYLTVASGWYSTAIGRYVTASDTSAIALGHGLGFENRLVNDTPYSLIVGFNDTTATLFVGGSDHRVGIRTENPTAQLDVNGDTGYNQVRIRTAYTPTGTADTNGNVGDVAWDDDYVYIKTSDGWKRATLSTF